MLFRSAEVSSSFAGVVKRHPLVPVAALALIVLTALSWYLLRRGTALEEEGEEDPDQYLEEEVARDEYVPRTPASPAQFAGTVVLEKRKKVEMPFTRL